MHALYFARWYEAGGSVEPRGSALLQTTAAQAWFPEDFADFSFKWHDNIATEQKKKWPRLH